MSTGNGNAVKSSNDAAAAAVTESSEGALAAVVKVEATSNGRRRRVGTLEWRAGETRGWRSTFLSI
jgi:hypothetical protein